MRHALSLTVLAFLLAVSPALAARQAWQVTHRSGAFGEDWSMAAFADADKGPGQMNLYCDTRDGFRVMFSPQKLAMTEGTGKVILTIDGAALRR